MIDTILEEVLEQPASEIEDRASKDSVSHGAFTRTQIDLAFGGEAPPMDQTWIALSLLMLDDPALRVKWAEWLRDQLARYHEDLADAELSVPRFAVDSACLVQYFGGGKASAKSNV